jgi:hypothetical protein
LHAAVQRVRIARLEACEPPQDADPRAQPQVRAPGVFEPAFEIHAAGLALDLRELERRELGLHQRLEPGGTGDEELLARGHRSPTP